MPRQRPGDESTTAADDVTAPGDSAGGSAASDTSAGSSGDTSSSRSGSTGRASRAPRRPTARQTDPAPGTASATAAAPDPVTPLPPPVTTSSDAPAAEPGSGEGPTAASGIGRRRPRIKRTTTRTRKTTQGTWIGYTTTRRQLAWVLTGVLALAIIVAAVLISRDDEPEVGDDTAFVEPVADQPQGLSEEQLRAFGAAHTGPVYWAGPRAGTTYELTFTSAGDIFVRYLPPGVAVGTDQADYLTVATYTRPAAYEALREVATGSGFTSEETASGAYVVYAAEDPTSAHFSFPDTDLQVEVYDPEPGRAVELVLDGSITLIR